MTFARFSLFWALILLCAPAAQPAFSQASLQARDTAPAGGTLSVAWQGPGGRQDTIYVTAAGAPDDAWHLALTYASKGSPAVIALNDKITPGQYEIRYRSVEDDQILARRTLTVVAPQASLSVPPRIIAGKQFEVGWTGPNEPKDYIALAKPGAGSIRLPIRIVRTADGSPVTHRAPSEVGPYVLRYQMGGSHLVVVEAPTEVVSAGTVITDLPPTVIETGGAITGGQDSIDVRAARSSPGPFDVKPDLNPDGTAIPGDMFDPSQQAIRSSPGPFDESPDLVESKSIGSSNPINVVTEGESASLEVARPGEDLGNILDLSAGEGSGEYLVIFRINQKTSIINHEEQYAIWPSDLQLEDGWRSTGETCVKDQCSGQLEALGADLESVETLGRINAQLERAEALRAAGN